MRFASSLQISTHELLSALSMRLPKGLANAAGVEALAVVLTENLIVRVHV